MVRNNASGNIRNMTQPAKKALKTPQKAAPAKAKSSGNPNPIKGVPGIPAHVPTERDRITVMLCMAQGFTTERTAKLLGIGETTLRKYYREELDVGADKALTKVAGVLFSIATDRNHPKCATAAIFLLKAKGGWRDNAPAETDTPDGHFSFSINISGSGGPPRQDPKVIDA